MTFALNFTYLLIKFLDEIEAVVLINELNNLFFNLI